MTDNPSEMAAQALRCRRLAKWSNGSTRDSLLILAEDYERRGQVARDGTDPAVPTIIPAQPIPT